MAPDDPITTEPVVFHARLTPQRSATQRGMTVVVGLLGLISLAAGLLFLSIGAWPVMLFLGLDVLLVGLFFEMHRRAGFSYEEVRVTPSELAVTRVNPGGRMERTQLNQLWTRLEKETHAEYGVTALALVSHGRRIEFGAFLAPAEKASLYDALIGALSEVRRGISRP